MKAIRCLGGFEISEAWIARSPVSVDQFDAAITNLSDHQKVSSFLLVVFPRILPNFRVQLLLILRLVDFDILAATLRRSPFVSFSASRSCMIVDR